MGPITAPQGAAPRDARAGRAFVIIIPPLP
jgi:hypothetical protein